MIRIEDKLQNMRCVMIEPNGKGGIAHYTYNLCSSLIQQDLSVTLITSTDYELSRFDVPFSVRKLFREYSLDENVFVKGIKYITSAFRLIRVIKEEVPTFLHYQWIKIPILDLFIILLVKSWRIPTVHTAHNILPHREKFYHKWIYRKIYEKFDKIIVHSNNDKKKILELCSMDFRKVQVILHGNYMFFAERFPITREKARSVLSIPPKTKVALFFGPIVEYKGLEYLLRAFAKVVRRIPSSMVVIAGRPSPDFSKYQRLMAELGIIQNSIVDLRYIPLEEVSTYFAAADVVITPYLNTYQSGVIQLAYAFGLPVIATTVGGLPEVVRAGETGYLIPPANEQALSDAIIEIFTNQDKSKKMGKRGRKLAEREFSWNEIARETVEVYKRTYG